MIRYLNIKTSQGIKTIDQINSNDFNSFKEFKKELKRLKNEYTICHSFYFGCYWSQRSTKDW